MEFKLNTKILIPLVIIWFMFIAEIAGSSVRYIGYTDELVTLFFVCFLSINIVCFKQEASLLISLYCYIGIVILGILGNILNRYHLNNMAIVLDIISNTKMIAAFWGMYLFCSHKDAEKVIKALDIPAKIFIASGLFLGLASIFIDLGMSGETRFGIRSFRFVFPFAHAYAMMIIACTIIIAGNFRSRILDYAYILGAMAQMVLTTKGPSLIWAFSLVIIFVHVKYNKKVKISLVVMMLAVCLLLGQYQIKNYFLRPNVPRATFLRYCIPIANRFFPIGAGFSSYGSDMSAKYYSPIYFEYGINKGYGMSPYDTQFMRDNYWPMIAGQFGWIGLIMELVIFGMIFHKIQETVMPTLLKSVVISAFLYIVIHSIGSSTPCTSICALLVMVMAVALKSFGDSVSRESMKCGEANE